MILFIVIIIIIYLIVSNINIFHVDSLPEKHKNQLKKRVKLRSMLLNNHLKQVVNKKSSDLPNAPSLIDLIRSEYVDPYPQYVFNKPNLPMTTRYPHDKNDPIDQTYIKLIKGDITSWNLLFKKYYSTIKKFILIKNIKLITVQETETEFLLTANVSLTYLSKTLHLNLLYHGENIRSDDFLNGAPPIQHSLQLVRVIPIKKGEYDAEIKFKSDPFITMADQLSYVQQVNFLHQQELDK